VLEPLSVTVADRRQDRELVLVGVLGLFISGRVQTRNGEPAPGAEVVGRAVNPWFGDSAEADSSGCFRIGPLPPGEYLLHANASNVLQSFAPENALRVHAGVEDIFLRLPEIGALNVRLISATGGKPIEGSLLISPGCVDGVPLGGSVHSFDAAGEVALENISFGRYDLVAWGGDGLVATAPRVNVPGAGGQPTTLAARRGGVVRLLGIAEEDFVYATHEDALVGVRGVLDENTLLLPEGPATIWRVRREAPQGSFESRTVDVTAGGDPIEVDFASGSGG
jgi:hypothetical protein